MDQCDSATGLCVYFPMPCSDGNACTADSCDTATGCVYDPIPCDDGDACTTDSCDSATGCVYDPISCDDGDACTTDSCDSATGCVNTPLPIIPDNNICTDDSCDPATGLPVYTPNTASCDDGAFCNGTDTCSDGECVHSGVPCTDPELPVCNEIDDRCDPFCQKTQTIRGGGQNPNGADLQIQTEFTVTNGCINGYTTKSITVSVGSTVEVNCHVGVGPDPTSGTWNKVQLPQDTPLTIECPTVGEAGKLIITNKAAEGGKDTDRMTIKVVAVE
jgi:hypothetical protein